jgi:hypothetical protein
MVLVVRESVFSRFLWPVFLCSLGAAFFIPGDDLTIGMIGAVIFLGGIFSLGSGIFFSDRLVLDGKMGLVRKTTFRGIRRKEEEYPLREVKALETRVRATEELSPVLILLLESGAVIPFPEGSHRHSERIRKFIGGILGRQISHREIVT